MKSLLNKVVEKWDNALVDEVDATALAKRAQRVKLRASIRSNYAGKQTSGEQTGEIL